MPAIMKLTDVGSSPSDVEQYLASPNWILQQKFDGTRIQAQWNGTSIFFSNNGIDGCGHAAAKLKLPLVAAELYPLFAAFTEPVTIEGELLIRTGEFVVWDLLIGDDPAQWGTTAERYNKLAGLLSAPDSSLELVKLSPTAWLESEKREMWERINVAGVEGAVSKHIDSEYVPGVRSGFWVKHKLCVRADLVVLTAQRTFKPENPTVMKTGSAQLGVYENGELRPICSASLIGKDPTIEPGDVVEIEYLYREPGGGLVQPRIKFKREDKAAEDCDTEQFRPYSREVVR